MSVKKNLSIFLLTCFAVSVSAQYANSPFANDIRYVPEVEAVIYDSALYHQNFKLGFTTFDVKMSLGQQVSDPSSIQVISATAPYPPLSFVLSELGIQSAAEHYMFQDFRTHGRGRSSVYMSLTDSCGTGLEGYVTMTQNHGRYSIQDTVGTDGSYPVDQHSFVIDSGGHYWFMTNRAHQYDMSHKTERKHDTAASVKTSSVEIWDPATRALLYQNDLWDKGAVPLKDIPLQIIEVGGDDSLEFDVTHPNSWMPAGDVNGCAAGVLSDLFDGVKFVRLCDGTILRYGAAASDFTPVDKADHRLLLQHDFKLIESGIYKGYFACFDGGSENYIGREARVPILKFDFQKKTVAMVDEYKFDSIYPFAQGNVDFMGDYMIVNLGVGKAQAFGQAPNWIIYNLKTKRKAAEYYLPRPDFAYNVWFVSTDIPQPAILSRGNTLYIDSTQWAGPLWSTGERSFAIKMLPGTTSSDYYVTVSGGAMFRTVGAGGATGETFYKNNPVIYNRTNPATTPAQKSKSGKGKKRWASKMQATEK